MVFLIAFGVIINIVIITTIVVVIGDIIVITITLIMVMISIIVIIIANLPLTCPIFCRPDLFAGSKLLLLVIFCRIPRATFVSPPFMSPSLVRFLSWFTTSTTFSSVIVTFAMSLN